MDIICLFYVQIWGGIQDQNNLIDTELYLKLNDAKLNIPEELGTVTYSQGEIFLRYEFCEPVIVTIFYFSLK